MITYVDKDDCTARTIPFSCNDRDWELLLEYFQLRERVFVLEHSWDLNQFDGHELDAYDKETSSYIIAQNQKTGRVVGGARLSPTVHKSFSSPIPGDAASFMIGDAIKGFLPGLPKELCYTHPPIGESIWELTRLVTKSHSATQALFTEGRKYLESIEVEQLLALGSPAILRVARRFGLHPTPLGPVVSNATGSFLAFSIEVSERNFAKSSESLRAENCEFTNV